MSQCFERASLRSFTEALRRKEHIGDTDFGLLGRLNAFVARWRWAHKTEAKGGRHDSDL